MTQEELHRLARIGAEARLQELEQERAAIFRAFPALRAPAHAAAAPVSTDGDGGVERPRPRRRRRMMSPEARERIAEAQRKRWAAWKAKQGTESEAGASAAGGSRKKK